MLGHTITDECTLTFEPVRPSTTPDAQTEEIQRESATPLPVERSAMDLAHGVLRRLFRGAEILELEAVDDLGDFRSAWQITLGNASACANPILAAVASVLLDAAGRLDPDELVEGRIALYGRTYEVWIDTARLVLLASVARPDLDAGSAA